MHLAPIALFVYNRPWHTQQTIEALQKNELSSSSRLFVFSDGPKNEQDAGKVQEVRDYINSIQGFKDQQIIEREANWGLADNIIDGVTRVINEYGRIIVLEDDLVTSPYFLRFMNEALEWYKNEKNVWHISGWNYPIDPEGIQDIFLWRVMNCWGWATWSDRWQYFNRDPEKLVNEFSKDEIKHFNLDGAHNFWNQIKDNVEGRIRTWGVFWYATIFKNYGLCLNPSQSLVQNIGYDGSGTNCGTSKSSVDKLSDLDYVNLKIGTPNLQENDIATGKIRCYMASMKPSIFRRMAGKVKRTIFR
jgi:hypothetical protein